VVPVVLKVLVTFRVFGTTHAEAQCKQLERLEISSAPL
jgi:hypothetical protein